MERSTMPLPVQLTDDELLIKAKELAARLSDACEVEDRKKIAVAECKAETDRLKGEIHELGQILRTGKETREVKIREVRDNGARTIETIRIDTGEVVCSRAMTIHELQRPLFEDQAGPKANNGLKVV